MDVLSRGGLAYFWEKCKSAFAAKSHAHDAGDITSGTLDDARIPATVARASDIASLGDSVSQTAARVPGRMFVGTAVSTVDSSSTASGHEARLFTKEEFATEFGRPFDQSKDYVGVMNADGTAANAYLDSVTYFSASGNIWVGVSGGINGNSIRLNYLVVLAD